MIINDQTPKTSEIVRLKNLQITEDESSFLKKCNDLVKKWNMVIYSDIGNDVKPKDHNLVAYMLEQQYKLNKGELPESTALLSKDAVVQNYALAIIRKLIPKLANLNAVNLYKVFSNPYYENSDIYVETIYLPFHYNISDLNKHNSDDVMKYFAEEVITMINAKILKTNKFLASPLLLTRNEDDEKTIYVRFVLK